MVIVDILSSGEWWDANPIDVVRESTRTGASPNISDAYTINGQPGDLYNCSNKGNFITKMNLRQNCYLIYLNCNYKSMVII